MKHFKWEPRGKRRLHKTPAQRELEACYQWLEGEIAAVQPALIVALGATAAKTLLGPRLRITQSRGQVQRRDGLPDVLATYHPSFLFSVKDRPGEEEVWSQFVGDLRTAARLPRLNAGWRRTIPATDSAPGRRRRSNSPTDRWLRPARTWRHRWTGWSCPTLERIKGDAVMDVRGFAHARALSRQFFPTWSRRARARWVLAKLKAKQPKVAVSSAWSHNARAYWFQRTARV